MTQSWLMDPTQAERAAAVDENLFALFRAMRAIPGCEVLETDRFCAHHAFPGNPFFAGVWRARLTPAEVEDAIDAARAWFRQRGAKDFLWWTGPQTRPSGLGERLLRRGFDGNLEGDPGMALDIQALNENIPAPHGLTIERALDRRGLEAWGRVFAASFNLSPSEGQDWAEATLAAGLDQAPWHLYLGSLDGEPAACSLLFPGAGVAGLYAIGTLPAARRQGLGAAITLHPLRAARELGARYAVLYASRLGYPVYRRIGFREVNCKIGVYYLELDQS